MKFEKITIPPGWQESFTKYPNGRTIFEALTSTITSVNEGIDAVNTKVDQGLLAIDAAADTIRSEVNSSFLILQNKLEQDLEYLQDDLVADISVLQSQVDAAVASVADKVTQSQLAAVNAQLADIENVQLPLKAGKTQSAEVIASLINGWTGTLKYTKDDLNVVTLRGTLTAGVITVNTLVMIFPLGFRPAYLTPAQLITISAPTIKKGLYIHPNGSLMVSGVSELVAGAVYHINIRFLAEG